MNRRSAEVVDAACVPWYLVMNQCFVNNGGCQMTCTSLSNQDHVCGCHPGYRLNSDKRTCSGMPEYKSFSICIMSNIIFMYVQMSMSVLKGLMTVTITVSIPLAAFDALAPLAMS
jgi:hypothetical protein